MKFGLAAGRDGGAPRLVASLGDGLAVDVARAAEHLSATVDPAALASPKALVAAGDAALAAVGRLVETCRGSLADLRGRPGLILDEADVTLLPPIPDPGKFLCVGKNYRAHLDELVRENLIREIPKEPTAFVKLPSVLVGQDAEVKRPDGVVKFDYEPELAFVIGRPAYKVARADAMAHVAGITLFNDLTAREIQKREVESGTRFWTAKNMPGFAPIGMGVSLIFFFFAVFIFFRVTRLCFDGDVAAATALTAILVVIPFAVTGLLEPWASAG